VSLDWRRISEETLDMFKVPRMDDYLEEESAVIKMHWPHPEERNKNEMIQAESKLKGVPAEDHPGWSWWLCQPCGTWHRQGAYDIDTREP